MSSRLVLPMFLSKLKSQTPWISVRVCVGRLNRRNRRICDLKRKPSLLSSHACRWNFPKHSQCFWMVLLLKIWQRTRPLKTYMLITEKTLLYYHTVNRGNFERWGNFEHHPICSFNDLRYHQNGRVYQKLYFLLVVPIIVTISTTKTCTYESKLGTQK